MTRLLSPNTELPSRRRFLVHSLRAAAGVWAAGSVCPRLLPASVSSAPQDAALQFGFTTYTWGRDWNLPTMLANLQKAEVFGVELRTSLGYAHGVELNLDAGQRREVRQRFADSPVVLVGLASSERMDWPDPERLKAAIDGAKAHVKLSHDVGGSGVRVFPDQFHKEVPREKTIAQIARSLNEIGEFAADYGQEIRLEAHGSAGELTSIAAIMDQVDQPQVRVKLNSDVRDAAEFEQRFHRVKDRLAGTLHVHDLTDTRFPYQLQSDLLVRAGWSGWALLEVSHQVPDRVQAIIEQRQIWERMVAAAQAGA